MQKSPNNPLIRHIHTELKRGGGGAGYLFNLRLAVDTFRDSPAPIDIKFDFHELRPSVPTNPSPIRSLRRQIGSIARWSGLRKERRSFSELFSETVHSWKTAAEKQIGSKENAERLFDCDLLFVHHILMAECLTKLQPNLSRQKLVLITHAPTFIAHEIASNVEPMADTKLLYEDPRIQSLVEREAEVMNSVRAVAWPCLEAQEGYLGWTDKRHKDTLEIFVETGVARPAVAKARETQRAEWGIKPNQRVALFIGRPHPHKGFIRFLDWADFNKKSRKQDWIFVQAGDKPALQRDVSALRSVGYIRDNGSAYAAADLILVPNKYSYLDIGLLEMLSLGARPAISPTGGHRHVRRICPALATIPDEDVESSWKALETAADEYETNRQATHDLARTWESRFSLNPFRLNHISAVQELLS